MSFHRLFEFYMLLRAKLFIPDNKQLSLCVLSAVVFVFVALCVANILTHCC